MLMMMADNVQQTNHDYTGSFLHNKPLQEAKDDRIFNCKNYDKEYLLG